MVGWRQWSVGHGWIGWIGLMLSFAWFAQMLSRMLVILF